MPQNSRSLPRSRNRCGSDYAAGGVVGIDDVEPADGDRQWRAAVQRGPLLTVERPCGRLICHAQDPVGGGRLYATAMAAMILEVYHRHLPVYILHAKPESLPTE